MSDVLSYGMNAIQQAAEDYAKDKKERDKQEAAAIGNRGLYDKAVQAGVLDLQQQIEFNKGSASKKNEILAGAMRTWDAQRQQEQDQMRKQAFQLQLNQEARAKAQFGYKPGADVYNAAAASNLNVIPGPPGQPPTFHPYAQPTPTAEQIAEAKRQAEAANVSLYQLPTGEYRTQPKPGPATAMGNIPGQGPVPLTSEAWKNYQDDINPAGVIHRNWGAKPTDFMPQNVEVGGKKPDFAGGGFSTDKDEHGNLKYGQGQVRLKNTGQVMDAGQYSAWLNKLADAGQLDEPVKHPITGQTITPAQPMQAQRNPRFLDYTDPASIGIMQSYLRQANGDPGLAKALARRDKYVWDE